jgi:hypothetical protein
MSVRSARAVFAAAVIAGALPGGHALAQDSDDHPLARIKKHEQELEKKIETERDRPDKKQHAKKVVNHAEENIRDLGEQIKGAGREIGGAAKKDENEAARPHRGAAASAPKKRTRPSEISRAPATTTSGAAGAAGTVGTGGASGTFSR